MGHFFSANNRQRAITTRLQLDEEIVLFRQDQLISSFLEIAVDQTAETARILLQTTDWNIDQAVNLFLTNNAMYREVVDSTTSGTSDDSDSRSSFSFPPPSYILHEGLFEYAKYVSIEKNLWLVVNLQSRTELGSHILNRDVWANDAVSRTIESHFIVWQVYDDTNEGQKISSFYKIEAPPPVVFVINPITGQKMHMWSGVIEAESIVEDLMMFWDAGPHENIASLTRNRRTETAETCLSSYNFYETPAPSWGEEFEEEDNWSSRSNNNQVVAPTWEKELEEQDEWEIWSSRSDTDDFVPPFMGDEYEDPDEVKEEEICLVFPVLTEEPKGDCDRSVVCSLCVRFPDGRRKQRKFLKSEPIQLLWSFCYSHIDKSEKKAFKLVQAIPGASKTLDCEADATFDQSGLANSLISVTWE
ncbi:unnamed protein product [Arabidopsis thaliana]|uniref:UBX domain-containing protein n=1 Tax=Arabidopsis thaliana TaxID=3702 RepID=A0A654FP52_ARATH|nr:unnamed protein product [Arabidopsis thaliana]